MANVFDNPELKRSLAEGAALQKKFNEDMKELAKATKEQEKTNVNIHTK